MVRIYSDGKMVTIGPGSAVVNAKCCSDREHLCDDCRKLDKLRSTNNQFERGENMRNRRSRYEQEDHDDVLAMTANMNPIEIITNERRAEIAANRRNDGESTHESDYMTEDDIDIAQMAPRGMTFTK